MEKKSAIIGITLGVTLMFLGVGLSGCTSTTNENKENNLNTAGAEPFTNDGTVPIEPGTDGNEPSTDEGAEPTLGEEIIIGHWTGYDQTLSDPMSAPATWIFYENGSFVVTQFGKTRQGTFTMNALTLTLQGGVGAKTVECTFSDNGNNMYMYDAGRLVFELAKDDTGANEQETESTDGNLLVGVWQGPQTLQGKSIFLSYSFSTDHTFSMYCSYEGDVFQSASGTWQIVSGGLSLTAEGETAVMSFSISNDGNTLVLNDPYGETYTLQK